MSHEKTPEEIVAERILRENLLAHEENMLHWQEVDRKNEKCRSDQAYMIQSAVKAALKRLSRQDPNYDWAILIKVEERLPRIDETRTWWGGRRTQVVDATATRDLVAWRVRGYPALDDDFICLGRDGALYQPGRADRSGVTTYCRVSPNFGVHGSAWPSATGRLITALGKL